MLTAEWRCLDCPTVGAGDPAACDKAAEKHGKATGHSTSCVSFPKGG